jgi:hypothetical protein
MVITMFKQDRDLYRLEGVPFFYNQPPTLDNIRLLFERTNYVAFLRNSAVIGVIVVLITLVVAIPAGYSLARLAGRWGERAGILIFLVYLVPPTLLFIPLFRTVVQFGLQNTIWSLIVTYPTMTIPFSTWLLMVFFNSIPRELEEAARVEGMNFVAWMLGSHGNRCRISAHTIKEDKTAPFDGHSDDDLTEYIGENLETAVEKQDYVSFTYSSSKYLKLKHMSITLVNRYQRHTEDGSFDYEDWKRLFEADVDLYNYLEEEKRTLFKRYIKYAKEVGVIAVEESNGDVFENEYRVKSRATKDQEKLVDELMEKMAQSRMQDDFEEALREKKRDVVTELERAYATGGPTLDDFMDEDSDEEGAADGD